MAETTRTIRLVAFDALQRKVAEAEVDVDDGTEFVLLHDCCGRALGELELRPEAATNDDEAAMDWMMKL